MTAARSAPPAPRLAPARAGRSPARCHRRRRASRPRGRAASWRRRHPSGGVSRSACSASSAAAAGAPRARADRAASSSVAAISRFGSVVASARCRARSSLVGTIVARRACSARRRDGTWWATTAEPSSGWVNRRRSPSSSRILAARVSVEAGLRIALRRPLRREPRSDRRAPRRSAPRREPPRSRRVEAGAQELVEVGRDRQLLSRRERAATALEGARELEREEGVAARRLPEPDQGRSRERHIEVGMQQLVRRADTQPADLDRLQPSLGHRAAKPGRHVARTASRAATGSSSRRPSA